MKDNKLIAEFMGLSHCEEGWITIPNENRNGVSENEISNDLQYHTSWDWLMPVLVKIEKIEVGDGTWTSVYFDIEREHKKAVEFIKTHNAKRLMSWVSCDEPFICGSCREHCSEYTYSEDRDVDECNNCKTSNHENSNPR